MICKVNQLIGFYMMGKLVFKGLKSKKKFFIPSEQLDEF